MKQIRCKTAFTIYSNFKVEITCSYIYMQHTHIRSSKKHINNLIANAER